MTVEDPTDPSRGTGYEGLNALPGRPMSSSMSSPVAGPLPDHAPSVPKGDELRELIYQARAGDLLVLGALVERYRGYLTALAERQLGNRLAQRFDPADVVQQSLMEACQGYPRFQGETAGELTAWLSQILHRNIATLIRDHYQTQKRTVQRDVPLQVADPEATPTGIEFPADDPTPSQFAMRLEDMARLKSLLDRLPEDQRTAVRLRHLEGWSLSAIADHLGRSTAAAAGLVKRGMESLRRWSQTV